MNEEKSWKYRIQYERAAGVGKTDGFKVEASGDDKEEVERHAFAVYMSAICNVQANYPQVAPAPEKKEAK